MDKLKRLLHTYIYRLRQSIAFLPVPMILTAVVTGIILFWLENNTEISGWVGDKIPSLAITSQDTARTTLGLFVGGLISLTVFAFSQIMVLLNQVASSYSPRLLRKMTGDRSLQFVMGFYMATIVLTLFVLLSIRSNDSYKIPNFSILLCVVLGTACLCMFIYFVSTLSERIQVDSIIRRVTNDCNRHIKDEQQKDRFRIVSHPREISGWSVIATPHGGYIGTVDFFRLAKLGGELETRFYLWPRRGEYVPQRLPLIQSERPLNDLERETVLAAISPVPESIEDWYLPHYRQLTEIALKAMSPGINDPGTALDVVDHQTELLVQLMELPPYNCYEGENGGDIFYNTYTFAEVLRLGLQEMRQYSKNDPMMIRQLFQQLFQLLTEARNKPGIAAHIRAEIRALVYDANRNVDNPLDREDIARTVFRYRNTLRHQPAELKPVS